MSFRHESATGDKWTVTAEIITGDKLRMTAETAMRADGSGLDVELVVAESDGLHRRYSRIPYYTGSTSRRTIRFSVEAEEFRHELESGQSPAAIAADTVAQLTGFVFNIDPQRVTVSTFEDDIPF